MTVTAVGGATTAAGGVGGATTAAGGVGGATTAARGVGGATTAAGGVGGATTAAGGVGGTTTAAGGVVVASGDGGAESLKCSRIINCVLCICRSTDVVVLSAPNKERE